MCWALSEVSYELRSPLSLTLFFLLRPLVSRTHPYYPHTTPLAYRPTDRFRFDRQRPLRRWKHHLRYAFGLFSVSPNRGRGRDVYTYMCRTEESSFGERRFPTRSHPKPPQQLAYSQHTDSLAICQVYPLPAIKPTRLWFRP